MLFASPDYDGDNILVIQEHAGSPLVFNSFFDCSVYVYDNFPALQAFAIQSFAPLVSEVHNIACFPVSPGVEV